MHHSECIVMLRSVWHMLGGISLRSDYKLTMESVNTSTNKMLGVIENLPLDFGAVSYPIHLCFSSEVLDTRSDPQIHTGSVTTSFFIHILFI
jgi:hypothetical protein